MEKALDLSFFLNIPVGTVIIYNGGTISTPCYVIEVKKSRAVEAIHVKLQPFDNRFQSFVVASTFYPEQWDFA